MSASAECVCVPPPAVHIVWPGVAHLIERAVLRTGLSSFGEIEADVLAARALLWLAYSDGKTEAAVVTQITKNDCGKVCTIVACGGKVARRWVHLTSEIESYAKAEGCGIVRIFGRKGWARLMPAYKATHVILERQI